ncbi:MAG TPA: hypothetical protein VFG59_07930 [Anaeromyxobacter sp.]|nr:hypothetical protein [Anaeromyxobacter sp.]
MTRAALALLAAAVLGGPAGAAETPADAQKTYRLVTDGSTSALAVGETGKLVVAFDPLAKGVHVDPKAPLRIRVEASAGLKPDKVELRRADAVDASAESPRFEVPVRGVAAGAQEAKLQMDFFVCTDSWCVKQARTLSFAVQVR